MDDQMNTSSLLRSLQTHVTDSAHGQVHLLAFGIAFVSPVLLVGLNFAGLLRQAPALVDVDAVESLAEQVRKMTVWAESEA